jgi:sporulation protein YlmC with PRC-barrel domain
MTLVKVNSYYSDYNQSAFSEYDITKFRVITKGDEKVGSVANILFDENSGQLRYFVVDTGFWVLGKKVLLPIALGRIVYMDRQVYIEELTKEQVKALPEYMDSITVDHEYEKRVRSILRPLVAEATTNHVDNSATYDLDQEPYFYEIKDQRLKEVQEQLAMRKSH